MTRILILAALATVCICPADTLKVISASRVHDRSISAFSDDGGAVTLEGRQLWLEVRDPDGVIGAELLVLFDPGAKTFWWQLAHSMVRSPADQSSHEYIDALANGGIKVYSGRGKIVAFENQRGLMDVCEQGGHAESLDDAERKSLALAQAWSSPDLERRTHQCTDVKVLGQVDRSFYSNPLSEAPGTLVNLVSAARIGNEWVIVMHGLWSLRFTMDDQYHVTKWERVPDGTPATAH